MTSGECTSLSTNCERNVGSEKKSDSNTIEVPLTLARRPSELSDAAAFSLSEAISCARAAFSAGHPKDKVFRTSLENKPLVYPTFTYQMFSPQRVLRSFHSSAASVSRAEASLKISEVNTRA